ILQCHAGLRRRPAPRSRLHPPDRRGDRRRRHRRRPAGGAARRTCAGDCPSRRGELRQLAGRRGSPRLHPGDEALVAAVQELHPGGIDAVLDVASTTPERLELISRVLVRPAGKLLSTIEPAEASTLAARGVAASTFSLAASAELLGRIAALMDA